MKYSILIFFVVLCSCNWAKQRTKETVNKTGQVVAETGSEFVAGVSKGIEKTFQNKVIISDNLKSKGLSNGKIIILGTDSTTDNILSVYLIFEQDFDNSITVKIFSNDGQEYGRVVQKTKGIKGEARYVDFVFDKRTNIDSKSKLTLE